MLDVIPYPVAVRELGTWVSVPAALSVAGPDEKVQLLIDRVRAWKGVDLRFREGGLPLETEATSSLSPAAYRLTIDGNRILIEFGGEPGLHNALTTLAHLWPSEPHASWRAMVIDDYPRFEWRGGHLDVCRHFMPAEFVYRFIDLLAMFKFNKFHWHLTEDQGWRLEIKKYPRLTEVGAWRSETVVGHALRPEGFDGAPHGGFYTQDEARQVVAYAASRGIEVVPEIEMPGHAQAAISAYPALGNTGAQLQPWTSFGVSPHVYSPSDATIGFLRDVLDEVLDIFPSTYIHIGGDECPKDEWRASPEAQSKIQELGLADEHELQSWFVRQFDQYLASRGRRMVGWDEILEGGLAPGATVMSWRGEDGGIAAAQAGHDVVMTPGSHTYFDHYQSEQTSQEPLAIGGLLPLEKVYDYEPVPAALRSTSAEKHVLGSQFQLWTEYMPNSDHVCYMMMPRMLALSEVVWGKHGGSFGNFRTRVESVLPVLDRLGVNYRPLD